MRRMEKRTRDVVAASSVIPDICIAVQEAIYNSLDAKAKSIKVTVDLTHPGFSVTDDGVGIDPDGLYEHIGECSASSRIAEERVKPVDSQYGRRGIYLWALASLAHVEIESRVQDHWTSHRKVIQEGQILFNARSKIVRKTPGTLLKVRDLFRALPVRQKDLEHNSRYRLRMAKEIQAFCTNISLIWPKLAIDIGFTDNGISSMRIHAALSCRERFIKLFGEILGDELKYHSLTASNGLLNIRGYVALVQDDTVDKSAAWKQAKSYYQFVFFRNQWIRNFHQDCTKFFNQAALDLDSGIPIFVLKISCDDQEYDIHYEENGKSVIFRSQEQLQDACFDFLQLSAKENEMQDSTIDCFPQTSQPRVECTSENGPHSQEDMEVQLDQVKAGDKEGVLDSHDRRWRFRQNYDEISNNHRESNTSIDSRYMDTMCHVDNEYSWSYQEELRCDLYKSSDETSMHDLETSLPQIGFDFINEDLPYDHPKIDDVNWSYQDDRCDESYSCAVEEEKNIFLQPDTFKRITWETSFHTCESCGHSNTQRFYTDYENDLAEDKSLDYELKINERQASYMPLEVDKNETGLNNDDDDDIDDDYLGANDEFDSFDQNQLQYMAQDKMLGVFFEHSEVFRPQKQAKEKDNNSGERKSSEFCWISSKSTSLTHDQQDIYQNNYETKVEIVEDIHENDSSDELITKTEVLYDKVDSARNDVTSSYFSPSACRTPTKTWSSIVKIPQEIALHLRVDNIRNLKSLNDLKLNKSIFKQLQVIRQVDRKFILVTGKQQHFLLCIDQHAADERVRLEKFEEQVFGTSGRERNLQVHIHEEPLVLLVNHKERETMSFHENVVRSWGFNFEFLAPDTSLGMFSTDNTFHGEGFVELRGTPRIDTRVANAEDFREYIQVLSQTQSHSDYLRPPVITRFLHSRACRTAIMFGDWLSISQCQELIEQLQHCQFPFQCAHGRPSIVPLVEFTAP